MREENKNVSKTGWKRIFGKKWFFPAAYLVIAALLLTGVLWYQNLDNQIPEASDDAETELADDQISGDGYPVDVDDEEAQPVMEQQEVIQMPVTDQNQTEIVTKFYEYGADSEDQLDALVQYENIYSQSKGVNIASTDDQSFDVTASLSGTVTEVKEDPLLGMVVKISHENDLSTYYASLEDVLVETGAEVKQGDTIGSAGRNLFGQASGTHVQFELRKNGIPVNPEDYFNKPLSEVEEPEQREDNAASESDGAEGESNQSDGSEVESDQNVNSNSEDGDANVDTDEDNSGETQDAESTDESTTESSAAMANT